MTLKWRRRLFATGGVICLMAAWLTSPESIEAALLGRYTGALAWGPALFRVLLVFHGLALLAAARLVQARAVCSHAPAVPGAVPTPSVPWRALLALTACGVVLRAIELDAGLWYDEVLTLVDFVRRPVREIIAVFPSQNQHMLYSIAARLSVDVLGESAVSLRLPAVVFGVASVPALFMLARRVTSGAEAWLAAFVMTVSYHHIWFSQNARGYTALLLFATLSTWFWIEGRARRSGSWWSAYAAALVLGIWAHVTMVFVVAAHGIVHVASLAKPSARAAGGTWLPVAAWLLAGTASLQLLSLTLPEFLGPALHESAEPSAWQSPWWLLRETIGQLSGRGWLGAAALCGSVVLACGLASFARQDAETAGLLALPAVVCALAILGLGLNLWPRFFFFAMGFLILIGLRGLTVLGRTGAGLVRKRIWGGRFHRMAPVVPGLLVVVGSVFTLPPLYATPKQDFAGARDYVERERRATDAVVAVGLAGVAYSRYFAPAWPVIERRAELEDLRGKHEAVWLVFTIPVQLRAWHPDLWDVVERDCRAPAVFRGTLGGGDLTVCRLERGDEGGYAAAASDTVPGAAR